jgi:hypothetical protein
MFNQVLVGETLWAARTVPLLVCAKLGVEPWGAAAIRSLPNLGVASTSRGGEMERCEVQAAAPGPKPPAAVYTLLLSC